MTGHFGFSWGLAQGDMDVGVAQGVITSEDTGWRYEIVFQPLSIEGYRAGFPTTLAPYIGVLMNVQLVFGAGHYVLTWDEYGSGSFDASGFAVFEPNGTKVGGELHRYERVYGSAGAYGDGLAVFYALNAHFYGQQIGADGTVGEGTALFSLHDALTGGYYRHVWTGEQHVFVDGSSNSPEPIRFDFVGLNGTRTGTALLGEARVTDVGIAWNGSELGVAWGDPFGAGSQGDRLTLTRLSKAGEFVGEAQLISEQVRAAWGEIRLLALADGWATTWIEEDSTGGLAPFIRRMAADGPSPYAKLQLQQAWERLSPPRLIRTHEGLLVGWERIYPKEMRSELVLQRFGLCE